MIKEITCEMAQALARVKTAAFNGPPWNDHWTADDAERSLRQVISWQGSYGLYAEIDGETAGYVLGVIEQMWDGAIFGLKELCILPEFQRRQVGTLLLSELKRELNIKGVFKIHLMTGWDASIQEFYRRNGFAEITDVAVFGTDVQ